MAAGKSDDDTANTTLNYSENLNDSDLTPLHETEERTFRLFDAILIIFSLITYLVDTLTDVLVSVEYFQGGHYVWGGLTLGFVVLPSFIIQGFSLRWYHSDGKLTGCRPWLIHIFHLQPLERYMQVLAAGVEARRSEDADKVQAYYYQQNDVCMLRLFEAFLESAPQLTLQLYIMVSTDDAGWLTSISAGVSLLAIGWAVAAYNHALRQAHKDNYRLKWPGVILQTLWHIGIIAARVCALVAFASMYQAWIFLVLGLHWVLMTVWVILQNTDFCPTKTEEKLFNAIVGIIYVYCFFSLKEGQTRWRMTVFYTIMFIENVILIGVWYPFKQEDGWTTDAIIAIVFGAFFLGLACMLVYYRFCHPSGPIYCCPPSQEYSPQDEAQAEQLPRKNSGLYKLQVDLVPRTSTALLPRKAQLKPQTSMAMAAPPVVYKEVHTPSQLTPIKPQPGDRRVIDYDKTFEFDSTSMFQHYSIEASQAIAVSHCASLKYDGVDLTNIFLDGNSHSGMSPLIEDIENPRTVEVHARDDDSIGAHVLGSGVEMGAFEHPSFSFIDDNAPSLDSTRDEIPDCEGKHSPRVEKALSLSDEPSLPTPTGFHLSDWSQEGPPSNRFSALAPATPPCPRLLRSQSTPKGLPDFSPIREERFLNTNAGCAKFPSLSEQQTPPKSSTLEAGKRPPRLSDFASTPCVGQQEGPLALPLSEAGSSDSIFGEVGKALSCKAPLASPETSLVESPVSDLDETFDETVNISSYDNVPNESMNDTVGSYLDNISGLTYVTPRKRHRPTLSIFHPDPVIEKLTTV